MSSKTWIRSSPKLHGVTTVRPCGNFALDQTDDGADGERWTTMKVVERATPAGQLGLHRLRHHSVSVGALSRCFGAKTAFAMSVGTTALAMTTATR